MVLRYLKSATDHGIKVGQIVELVIARANNGEESIELPYRASKMIA